jgi:DnaJ like chaperone protein
VAPAAEDPRTLLGVGPDATAHEIRRAYREAVKRSHPDRVAHMDRAFQDLAHARMKALRRAYEALLSSASN